MKATTKLQFIEYSIAKSGTITPTIHFQKVAYNGTNYYTAKTDWQTIRDLQPSWQAEIEVDIKPPHATIVAVTKAGMQPIPVIDRCPCCKHPVTIETDKIKCTNPFCPERAKSNLQFEKLTKRFAPGNDFGDVHLIRSVAAHTPAIVMREKPGSNKPLIIYSSTDQLFEIFRMAGIAAI